jgi:hypothetical protein
MSLLSTACQRSTLAAMAEGFIRQRGNAWQVIVHAGRDPVTGKRRNLTGNGQDQAGSPGAPCTSVHPGR